MISIDEYKANPCRMSSIPYWKMKAIRIPNNILVVHEQEYCSESGNFVDTRYFRLKHDLRTVEKIRLPEDFAYRYVNTDCLDNLEEVVEIINACYSDVKVNLAQVRGWTETAVYSSDLWVFITDISSQKPVALGIAELDREVGEGALEWIQVLPQYRGRELGKALVLILLGNLQGKAEFVTVSGKAGETMPEKLYRSCGFSGNDIWHVLRKG